MVNTSFLFEFSFGGKTFELCVPMKNILGTDVRELAHRIINSNNIPVCFHEDLSERLKEYAKRMRLSLEDELGDQLLGMNIDMNQAVEQISQQFVMGHYGYGNSDVPSNDEIFADAYHELIHSPHYSSLLNMEEEHAVEMARLLQQRDHALEKVHKTCQQSMEMAVLNLGVLYTDEQVNQLAKQHIEATELEQSKWKSSVGSLREEQKRDFRAQVMKLLEASRIEMTSQNEDGEIKQQTVQNIENNKEPKKQESVHVEKQKRTPLHKPKQCSSQAPNNSPKLQQFQQVSRREDSFTVHLGAQMKTTHNLRLLSCDTFELCAMPRCDPGQRFQTAISLYSDRLCGMVLLVDQRLHFSSGIKKDFASLCERSTDFHFADLTEQMEAIRALHNKNNSNNSKTSSGADKLKPGEIYITKHSNLSQVHVVFHVAIDDSLRGDISSRHPVLLAYRNVVKTAFKNDVKTLSLPLLLLHEMSEDMTIGWCLKRAELVLKCLKGFVMEMFASEGSFNLQLILPPTISDDTFNNIAEMVPSIFRMSNPLIASSH